ncbi:MAG: family 78 glycoside hydrolase catalytic domain [Clostridia bacterium]|nr:family 78 glycoside hydrolase catalytic domain [Clostridia bacterium]
MKRSFTKKIRSAILAGAMALLMLAQPMLFAVSPIAAGAINRAPGAPFGLLTNQSEHPMNVEGAPMFDWWVNDADLDEVQTAYRIRLYDGVSDEMVWDSGKVESADQNSVLYTGDALKPGYPYSWEVRTWDKDGAVSPYSERAEFATGLDNGDWGAKWIQGISEDTESPLSIIEEEVNDVILQGEGLVLSRTHADWSSYEISAKLTPMSGSVGIAFRANLHTKDCYVWQLVPGVGIVRNRMTGGKLTALGEPAACEVMTGSTYTLSISIDGSSVSTKLNGSVVDVYTTDGSLTGGTFGFYTEEGQKTRLHSLSASQNSAERQLTFTQGSTRYAAGYGWSDYTVDFDMVINGAAAGFMLRCPDGTNGYMWQFNLKKGGLARHVQINNKFTKLDGDGAIPCSLTEGKRHHVTITVSGNVITTYLDGELIDTYTDTASTHPAGSFGMRQGSGETATLSNITVRAADGSILCREAADSKSNYSTPSVISVNEVAGATYSTEFSPEELAVWSFDGEIMPITSGTQKVYWAESSGDGVTLLNYGLDWTDYTLSLDVQVTTTSAGIVFRAPDNANTGYMWAVRSNGVLRLHKGESNKYVRIGTTAESDLSAGFVAGQTYHLAIKLSGNTITTYIDGVMVDSRSSDVSTGGSIGFRTDRGEAGRYTNVVVTAPDGKVLYSDDFSGGAVSWGTSGALNADNSYWYSRKEVKLDEGKQVKAAIAYVSGSQDYELTVSGVRIGRAQTYDYPGETRYQGWDITDAVKGKDSIAIGALTSYFGSGQGRAVSKPGLLGKFIIYYTDGTATTVVTDESWLTHATGYSNEGKRNSEGDEIEHCDARLMLSGWAEVGYYTDGWLPVIVHGAHPTKTFYDLEPEVGHVAETTVSPVKVTRLADGTTVADFGKVIPARIIIHFPDGTAGTTITIQEGYELLAGGSINTSTDSTQSTNMTYVYTMKDGAQTYEAWSYLGFRYVSVPKEAGALTVDNFEATILHAETVSGRESTLDTSDEMLDLVFEFMKRSALYSVQNQFVDTPTREKGQFLYDTINISAATTSGSYERQMTRKAILQFLASSDRHWSAEGKLGVYTAVYPNNDGARDIPEFTLSVPNFVWRYYMLTGDRELLEFAYPYMKNTAGYVTRNIDPATGLVTAIEGGTSSSYKQGIIDTPNDRFGYDWKGTLDGVRTTINAHSVRAYDVVSRMALELGYTLDAASYAKKADDLRAAMNKYLLTSDGVFCDGLTPEGLQSTVKSQHSTSHAIMAGTPTEEAIDKMADYIAGLGMRQGTMTADILLEALFKSGRGDAAVKLLTNTDDYGWAKLIDKGYTFIWETWHGGSQSHGWGSASVWQVIEYISGVKLLEAGAKKIRIDPVKGAISEVTSHTVTARGAVDISYSGSGRSYAITVEIPANMTAEIVFPIIDGGAFVELSGNSGVSELTDEGQIVTVGSGKRTFVYTEDIKEHSYEATVTPPGCISKGYTTYVCKDCGKTYTVDYVPALGHRSGEWTVTTEATCTTKGEMTSECLGCGITLTETIDAKGHDEIKNDAKSPTCTEAGWNAYVSCSRCDYNTCREVGALGHKWADATTEAPKTCTRCGLTEGDKLPAEPEPDTDPDNNGEDEIGGECGNDHENCEGGFFANLWNAIVNFFRRLFGMKEICVCGEVIE